MMILWWPLQCANAIMCQGSGVTDKDKLVRRTCSFLDWEIEQHLAPALAQDCSNLSARRSATADYCCMQPSKREQRKKGGRWQIEGEVRGKQWRIKEKEGKVEREGVSNIKEKGPSGQLEEKRDDVLGVGEVMSVAIIFNHENVSLVCLCARAHKHTNESVH